MRTLITWTLTLAVGASASGQGISPSTTKKAAPPAAPGERRFRPFRHRNGHATQRLAPTAGPKSRICQIDPAIRSIQD